MGKKRHKHFEPDMDDTLLDLNIESSPFLSVIYQKKGFVEKFHELDYDNQIKAYQTLVKLASTSNTNGHSRYDALCKLEYIMRSIGLHVVERQNCSLSKDERLIIRMDFYGSIDRIQAGEQKRKLSKPYRYLINHPLKKRPKMADYDFSTAPMWPLFARFGSFRKIEKDLKRYFVKNKIDPQILSVMNVRDFSDLIVRTFETSPSEMKIKFEKPLSVRKRFVMEMANIYGDEIQEILLSKGYDSRYVASMLNAMRRYGATKTDKLIITEQNFTERALKNLKKHKIDCSQFHVGDPIPQNLIDHLIDTDQGNLIAAYDENGQRLCSAQFPSFEVHHKHAVSNSGDLSNIASINYKNNLCLVLTDMHTFVLHGLDVIENNQRDAYSRRTEFFADDVVFMAGFEISDQIYHPYANNSTYKKNEKEDSRINVSYEDCLETLYQNQDKYLLQLKGKDPAKKDFDVDAVVSMVNKAYEQQQQAWLQQYIAKRKGKHRR